MSMMSTLEQVAIAWSSVSTGPGTSFGPASIRCWRPAGPASNRRSPRHDNSVREMSGAGAELWAVCELMIRESSSLDGCAHGVAPFGPTAVVVADVVLAQEVA